MFTPVYLPLKFKEALLKRFQLTEERFRLKFRSSKPEVGESPPQFVVRLEDYLVRWMDLAKVAPDLNGLKDLILCEQFMQQVTSRHRSGKGAIRKRFPLQKPRWEKTKLPIRYLYHETFRKPNGQLFSQTVATQLL